MLARKAGPQDSGVLLGLALSARETLAGIAPETTNAWIKDQVRILLCDHLDTTVVAEGPAGVVGFAAAQVVPPGPFADHARLEVGALYVDRAHRRQGAGLALLRGLADVATKAGAANVQVLPLGPNRQVQRFLARLGFASLGGYRVIPTDVLLAKLAPVAPRHHNRPAQKREVERLLVGRRRLREQTGEIPAVPAISDQQA
ncbi:MAG: GNAT family N-acetyltransferase [Bifidobacteriaceae bacterium]|jgi:GNAT superfamily N-acetyltransferase|nr:GNAT family N-acetyltransferase [Bifidobacteriaceae bacterium]